MYPELVTWVQQKYDIFMNEEEELTEREDATVFYNKDTGFNPGKHREGNQHQQKHQTTQSRTPEQRRNNQLGFILFNHKHQDWNPIRDKWSHY